MARRSKPCPKCDGPTERNGQHDVYGCRACDLWAEDKCGDPKCCYCPYRPDKPSQSAPESWLAPS